MNSPRPRVALAAVIAASALALGGCSLLQQFVPSSQPVRDASTGEVTEQTDNADVFSIRVGDCLNSSETASSDEISSVPVVPCDDPHEDEVYSSFDLADGEYPGEDAILDEAKTTCAANFATFIGIGYDESVLDLWPMYPTSASWESGDREVLCIAWDPAGTVTGTLEGAAR